MAIRSTAFIDKLTLTFQLDRSLWDSAACGLSNSQLGEESTANRVNYDLRKLYRYSRSFYIPGRGVTAHACHIDFFPNDPRISFLRLEWNPSKATLDAASHLIAIISPHFADFRTAWANARISRVDVTFDLYGLRIEDLYAFTGSANGEYERRTDNAGHLNGFYLNSRASDKCLLVYDKGFKNYLDRTGNPNRETWIVAFPYITRVEFQLRDYGRFRDVSTNAIECAMRNFHFAKRGAVRRLKPFSTWARFYLHADREGVQEVLRGYSRRDRSILRGMLKRNCQPEWYDRTKIAREAVRSLRQALAIEPPQRCINRAPLRVSRWVFVRPRNCRESFNLVSSRA